MFAGIAEASSERLYRVGDVFNSNDIISFLYDFQDGVLQPSFKTEFPETIEKANEQQGYASAIENIASIHFQAK